MSLVDHSIRLLLISWTFLLLVTSGILRADDTPPPDATGNSNICIDPDLTISGPKELYTGETKEYTAKPIPATVDGTFTWSVSGGTGSVKFFNPNATDECDRYSDQFEEGPCVDISKAKIIGVKQGPVKIKVRFFPCESAKWCPIEKEYEITVLDDFNSKPPEKFPLGGKLRRVDVHGVPMPDPSPTGEGEKDRVPNMAYTDMHSLAPTYSVSDVALPVEGGELMLEFRRTMGIKSRNYTPELDRRGFSYPPEDLLGLGWDTNLGARVTISFDQDSSGIYYTAVRVTDETGGQLDYLYNGQNYQPDIVHSFNNGALKATLVDGAVNPATAQKDLILTKAHGTKLLFRYVRTFSAVSKGTSCSTVLARTQKYYRLESITDRNGNQLVYTYNTHSASTPDGDTVVKSIHEAAHPERKITFSASYDVGRDEGQGLDTGWRLNEVTDPMGRKTTFGYVDAGGLKGLLSVIRKPAVLNGEAPGFPFPSVQPTVSIEPYVATLPDITLDPLNPPNGPVGYNKFVAPRVITDARGHATTFTYTDRWFPTAAYANLGGLVVWQKKIHVTSIKTDQDGTAYFDQVQRTATKVVTTAKDTKGTITTFDFNSLMIPAPTRCGFAIVLKDFTRTTDMPVTDLFSRYTYTTDFNCNLTTVLDMSGNLIRFEYNSGDGSDPYNQGRDSTQPVTSLNPNHYMLFDKPSARINNGLTTKYRYAVGWNRLTKTIDAMGQVRDEILDPVNGNRLEIREYLGFVVKRTLYAYTGDGFISKMTDPEDRVTNYVRGARNLTDLTRYLPITTTVQGIGSENLNIQTTTITDIMGNQRLIRDALGFETTMEYDALDRVVSTTKPPVANPTNPAQMVPSTSYSWYDLNGNPVQVKDDNGNVTVNTYDKMNRLTASRRRMTDPANNDDTKDLITKTAYDVVGLPISTTDAKGNVTDMTYDRLLRLTKKLKPAVTLPDNTTKRYEEQYYYGTFQDGTQDSGTNPGSGAFAYWSGWQATRVLSMRSRVGITGAVEYFFVATDTVYDPLYRAIQVVQRRDDAAGISSTAPARAAAGSLPAEPMVKTTYNAMHKVVATTTSNTTGGLGDASTYTYFDTLYRPTATVIDVDGGTPPKPIDSFVNNPADFPSSLDGLDLVTRTVYDRSDLTIQVTDPTGAVSKTFYDGAKRPIRTELPAVDVYDPSLYNPNGVQAPVLLTEFDKNGNKIFSTDINKTVTRFEYDARNRSIRTITDLNKDGVFDPSPTGPDTSNAMLYDLAGNILRLTDSRGFVTETGYDLAYRQVKVTQPQVADGEAGGALKKPVIITEYDKNSNITKMIDARGIETRTSFDELNRERSKVEAYGKPEAQTTDTEYDAVNSVIARVLRNNLNGGNQRTTYTYDVYGRQLSERLPDPGDAVVRESLKTYHQDGTLWTVRDAKLQTTEFTYDRARRVTKSQHKRADNSLEEERTFTLNKAGKALVVTDATGRSDFIYDAQQRMTRETRTPAAAIGQPAYAVNSSYDAMGNRTRVIYPNTTRTLVTAYDRGGRVLEVRDGTKVTKYTYDSNGNRLTLTTPNGVKTEHQYDALNRAYFTRSSKGATVVSQYDYTFDLVGNRIRMVETLAPQAPRTTTYDYDDRYQLISESSSGFSQVITYDQAGNRTRLTRTEGTTTTITDYVCDRLNRLRSSVQGGVTTTYNYDNNGNQTSQQVGTQPALSFVYDVHNRLVAGTVFGVTAGTVMRYDYRMRRQTKLNATTTTFYRYDLGDCFQEYQSTAMKVEFVRGSGMGGGIGSILYSDRTMAGGTEETFTYNPSVGHVVAMTDGLGMTTETNRFDAFGNIIATTGTSLNNRLANTKERDVHIAGVLTLDNHGFRYYNPQTGRYISRDPAGYPNGLNNYLYVNNNPINRIDPHGLWFWDAVQAALDVVGVIPLVGNVANVANAGISAARGDMKGAALNLAGAVPGVGNVAKAGSLVAKVVDTASKVAKAVDKVEEVASRGQGVADVVVGISTGDPVTALMGAADALGGGGKKDHSPRNDGATPSKNGSSESNHEGTNDSKVTWVDEKAAMSPDAKAYQDTAPGARSNLATQAPQAPQISYVDPKTGETKNVRFDGQDTDGTLVDRKLSVVTSPKAKKQMERQSEALDQNGLKGRWEVPDEKQKARGDKLVGATGVDNIDVKVEPKP